MKQSKTFYSFLLLLILFAFFSGQHILELRAEEPRRAFISMEMIFNGNYIVPHVNEMPYFNKPPIFNWLQIVFFKTFNSYGEWVARMPSLLAFMAMIALLYKLCLSYFEKKQSILISLMTLTCADLLFYGTVNSGEIDLFYCFLVFVQVSSIFYYSDKEKWLLMFCSSYFIMSLGFLTKGPPSIAFQILTLVSWLAYSKQFRKLFSWQHLTGILLASLVLMSYFWSYHQEGNAFDYLGRLFTEANQRSGMESNLIEILQNLFLFPLKLLKIMLPWSLFLFLIRKKIFKESFRQNKLISFSLIFILSNIWIYWFTGETKERYVYMFIPFFIVLIAPYLRKDKLILKAIIALLCIRVIFNFTYLPLVDKSVVAEYREISNEIHQITQDQDLFLFGSFTDVQSSLKIGPFNFYENTLKTAPDFAYQFNYYLSRYRNETIPFKPDKRENGFYIMPKHLVDQSKDSIVYEFFEKWQKMDRAIIWVEGN